MGWVTHPPLDLSGNPFVHKLTAYYKHTTPAGAACALTAPNVSVNRPATATAVGQALNGVEGDWFVVRQASSAKAWW